MSAYDKEVLTQKTEKKTEKASVAAALREKKTGNASVEAALREKTKFTNWAVMSGLREEATSSPSGSPSGSSGSSAPSRQQQVNKFFNSGSRADSQHCLPFTAPPSPTEAELKALARADKKKRVVLSGAPPKKKQCVAAITPKLEATGLSPPPFEEEAPEEPLRSPH